MSATTGVHLVFLGLAIIAEVIAYWPVNAMWKARLRGLGIDRKGKP